jgi:GINS complex subunit 1
MVLGKHAVELLTSERTQLAQGRGLPPYNEEKLKEVITETNQLQRTLRDNLSNPFLGLNAGDPYCAANIVALTTAMLRNKRCSMAYLKMREERLVEEWWRHGRDLPPETRPNLSDGEGAFLQGYDQLVTDYILDLGVDLRASRWPPLRASHKFVLSTAAAGEIPADDGHDWTVDGTGEMFAVARATADQLLQKGGAALMQ